MSIDDYNIKRSQISSLKYNVQGLKVQDVLRSIKEYVCSSQRLSAAVAFFVLRNEMKEEAKAAANGMEHALSAVAPAKTEGMGEGRGLRCKVDIEALKCNGIRT